MSKKKWTEEAIIKFVEDNGYKFIRFIKFDYRVSKILIWCGNPEHEPYEVRFDSFSRGRRCKKCHVDKKRKSHEEFKKELFDINPNIELLTEYKRANIKVKCRCKVCGHEWWAYPTNLIRSENPSGCPKCANRLLKTHEQFVKEVALKHPNIEVLSQYINDGSRVDCRCKIDGHEWSPVANTLLCGSGCRICGIRKRADAQRKSHEQFVKEVFEINPNIKILSEYKGQHEKIDCECLIDGCKWSPFAGNLLKNQGCPKCGKENAKKKMSKTHEQFIEEMAIKNPDIEVVGRYNGGHELIDCKCRICDCEWSPMASNILYNGSGCPKCNISKGEKEVENLLLKYNIKYEVQYKFEDCRSIRPLPFDFYLPDYKVCVEYDGEGHYFPVRFGGINDKDAFDNFISTIIRDTIKTTYCINNNIKIIRIPYWDFNNIENILIKELNL